jgi:hypothetical protein
VKPAEAVQVQFEPGLVNTILDDVETRPASLPLLQFALREMWGRLKTPMMTRSDYLAIGRAEGALASRAQAIFYDATQQGEDAATVSVFRRLFTRLVSLGEGAEDTRRIVGREELDPDAWTLAQRLAGEGNRLVVLASPAPGHETAEIVHEALIRNWPALVEWVNRDRAFLWWLRELKRRVNEWLADPTDEGVLLRGASLGVAEEWLARRGDEINQQEAAFVAASVAMRSREEAAVKAAIEQSKQVVATTQQLFAERRRRALFQIISTVLLLVIFVLYGITLLRQLPFFHLNISELSKIQIVGAISIFVISLWTIFVFILYLANPAKLVYIHEYTHSRFKIDELASSLDKFTLGAASVLGFMLKSLMFLLSTSNRAVDAWINDHAQEARSRFSAHPIVRERRISLDLPVTIDDSQHMEPWSELDRLMSRQAPIAILVSGPGGAGKTTLACRIGWRALGATDQSPIGGHLMIPILIDADVPEDTIKPDGFYPYMSGLLRSALNERGRISVALTTALLRSGRALIIVDGLSERALTNSRIFDPQWQNFEINRLIVTSRGRATPGITTVIETETIPAKALYEFLDRYLEEMQKNRASIRPSEGLIFQACKDLKDLLRGAPCTPLLAAMWAKDLSTQTGGGKPNGVAELMDSYIRQVLKPAANGDEDLIRRLAVDVTMIAKRELGDKFRPGSITRDEALEIVRTVDTSDFKQRFDVLEKSRMVETPAPSSNLVRISPDPIAEHLVARSRALELSTELDWGNFLDRLSAEGLPAGFLSALSACSEHEVYGRNIPLSASRRISAMSIRDERRRSSISVTSVPSVGSA